jgi:hypothetical protein
MIRAELAVVFSVAHSAATFAPCIFQCFDSKYRCFFARCDQGIGSIGLTPGQTKMESKCFEQVLCPMGQLFEQVLCSMGQFFF